MAEKKGPPGTSNRALPAPSKSLKEAREKALKHYQVQVGPVSDVLAPVEAISSGNISIDYATRCGGIPRRRITELFGPPSCGKTTTALQAAAMAQRMGYNIFYADYEFSLDPEYCLSLGLDVEADSFMLCQPESFEVGMNVFRIFVQTGLIAVGIVDSVAHMTTDAELKGETGKSAFADRAKAMAQTMRQLRGDLNKYNTAAIFLNHIHEVIDTSPAGQQAAARGIKRTTTPGGKALKFASSLRVEYRPIGGNRGKEYDALTGQEEDVVAEQKVQVTVVKNKVGSPFGKAEVLVRFGKGFSQANSIFKVLVAHKLIKAEKSGIYRFDPEHPSYPNELAQAELEMNIPEQAKKLLGDKHYLQGDSSVLDTIEASPEWQKQLHEIVYPILFPEPVVPEAEDAEDEPESYEPDPDEVPVSDTETTDEEAQEDVTASV